jgi:ABC-2 type transport system permease protein
MKRMLFFARRNTYEIMRDPISLFFGVLFPVVLLGLLSLINAAIPAQAGMTLYQIDTLAPGISAFGLCFLALFASMLVSKDRCSSFMLRLRTSPLRPWEYITGYCLPMLPMALAQIILCMIAAMCMGLTPTVHILTTAIGLLPTACLYIALGLLLGSVLSEKAVGGICGALMTNLAGWLSGTWFSVELIGGAFEKICKILPFYPSALAARALLEGNFIDALPDLAVVTAWALGASLAAVLVFNHKMKSDC